MRAALAIPLLAALAGGLGACAPVPAPAPEPKISPELIWAVGQVESSNRDLPCGRSGCGRYQVIRSTGRMLGYTPRELVQPENNRAAAISYLEMLHERFNGDLEKILSAYNCGPGKYKGRKCRAYARRVMGKL